MSFAYQAIQRRSMCILPRRLPVPKGRFLCANEIIEIANMSITTIWGLVRHHHCPSRGAAPGRAAYLRGELNIPAATAIFFVPDRNVYRAGRSAGTARGQFTPKRENSPLPTTRSNWLVNPGHRPPCDVCAMEKRWFSWRSGRFDHPQATPGNR